MIVIETFGELHDI